MYSFSEYSQRFLSLPFASLFLATLLLTGALSAQEPTVSNVQADQRAGTKMVEITYDLAVTNGSAAIVTLKASRDGGTTFETVPVASLSGAFGLEEAPGTGKTLVWDAGYLGWESALHPQVQVEIVASVGEVADGMVRVLGGTLAMSMGTVTVDTFDIGRYEVTWAEWKEVREHAEALGYDLGQQVSGCADDHPVASVDDYAALKWSNAKSEIEGLTPVYRVGDSVFRTGQPDLMTIAKDLSANGYRLPLEAEWEFAARGGNWTKGYAYAGSNDLDAVGWYTRNSTDAACPHLAPPHRITSGTWPVGLKLPNELGLYDMTGNVAEWCWDSSGSGPVLRGGSFLSNEHTSMVSEVGSGNGYGMQITFGFRLARSVDQAANVIADQTHSVRSDFVALDLRIAPVWAGAVPLRNGWFWLDWFGTFADISEGWIFHAEHGWQFFSGETKESLFLYDVALENWAWTSDVVYPWMYWFAPVGGWSLYERGSRPGDRWFLHTGAGERQHEIEFGGGGGPASANMALVQGGTLGMTMGTARVDSFWIGKYEVTRGEWKEVRAWAVANGYDIDAVGEGCADDHPVHSVNPFDVLKWSNAKSEMSGLPPVYTVSGEIFRTGLPDHTAISKDLSSNGYRLPLEAEWEFAARGGIWTKGYLYAGSDDPDAVAWSNANSGGAACPIWFEIGTWPVGQKMPNELGLYDMSGNVAEWTFDGPDFGCNRRGGSWNNPATDSAVKIRAGVQIRGDCSPYFRSHEVGFRLARSPDQ